MSKIARIIVTLIFFIMMSKSFADINSDYQAAIINSSLHREKNSSFPLRDIQTPMVRMVVYTTYDGYKTSDDVLAATIWTTVEPDIKKLCSQYVQQNKTVTHQQLSLWLVQLLGLSPVNAEKRRFVILNVPAIQAYYGSNPNKIGMFRPCTDPRISPHRDGTPSCPPEMDGNNPYISSDFKTWFINNSINMHALTQGDPWTEYGYTYNWRTYKNNSTGVTEFVVLKGTPIRVEANSNDAATAYITAEQYCRN